jgi:hypothetical protein
MYVVGRCKPLKPMCGSDDLIRDETSDKIMCLAHGPGFTIRTAAVLEEQANPEPGGKQGSQL